MIAIIGNRQLANQHHMDSRTLLGAGAGIESSGDRMAEALGGRAGRSAAGLGWPGRSVRTGPGRPGRLTGTRPGRPDWLIGTGHC